MEKLLIGLSEEDAIKMCSDSEYQYRIVRRDSENFIITMDLRSDRINLEIDDGVVTKCDLG